MECQYRRLHFCGNGLGFHSESWLTRLVWVGIRLAVWSMGPMPGTTPSISWRRLWGQHVYD